MGKVYQSVREVVQGSFHRRKPDTMVSAPGQGNNGSLNEAMEELEKIVIDGVGRLKAAVSEHQAVVASEAQLAEQLIEGLKANITALEDKLTETQDTLHRKDIASQKTEEKLAAEIHDLQSLVKKKEEDLESRDSEINDLKFKVDALVEQVTQLELAIERTKGEAASEAQYAEQVIEGLKANITALEDKLTETQDTLHRKDIASQKTEENLGAEIRDLQSLLKKKEEELKTRYSEVNDLKSKIDALVLQGTHLELAIQQAKGESASKAHHAEQVIEGLKGKITLLETKLTETEGALHRIDIASQKLEERSGAETRDLQSLLKKKEEELKSRDSEVNDLKSKVDALVEQVTRSELAIQRAKGEAANEAQQAEQVIESLKTKVATLEAQLAQRARIVGEMDGNVNGLDQQPTDLNAAFEAQPDETKKMSSRSYKADALADIRAQDIGTVVAGEQLKTSEKKLATRETVSQEAFDRIIADFSERTNVIGRIASLIVRHHVRALSESIEKFPQTRLSELLDSLSREIPDDKLKTDFRRRFANL